MAVCQNLVPLVNIKIAGKWMFIPLKMVLIGIDPYPYVIDHHVFFPGDSVLMRLRNHISEEARSPRSRLGFGTGEKDGEIW